MNTQFENPGFGARLSFKQKINARAAIALLLLAMSARAQEVTTSCTCSGVWSAEGKFVPVALLKQAPFVDGRAITSPYGWRNDPFDRRRCEWHNGLDIAVDYGSPIYSAGDGMVEQARWKGTYGRYLRVAYEGGVAIALAHLSKFATGIHAGAKVRRGEILAYSGNSGRSTAPHLHAELYVHNRRVRPECSCFQRLPVAKHRRGKRVMVKS